MPVASSVIDALSTYRLSLPELLSNSTTSAAEDTSSGSVTLSVCQAPSIPRSLMSCPVESRSTVSPRSVTT